MICRAHVTSRKTGKTVFKSNHHNSKAVAGMMLARWMGEKKRYTGCYKIKIEKTK